MSVKSIMDHYSVILASQSARRKEILENIGMRFRIVVSHDEEKRIGAAPEEIVKNIAVCKALDVWKQTEAEPETDKPRLVIAADTIVLLDDEILGKPVSPAHAAEMLARLSGRWHKVLTGVCLKTADALISFCESTEVSVYPLTPEDIREYVATGEPMDKAGAYGAQGIFSRHVCGIRGDFFNVIGLPAARLVHEADKLIAR